jgi:hypothetical protein
MAAGGTAANAPVTSVAAAVARLESIGAALPPGDGLGCFSRMYLRAWLTTRRWTGCWMPRSSPCNPPVRGLVCDSLAATTAAASRLLLIAG